ncbi:hypothetical protein G647_09221 [Cladophialophora carrionii CBS 160.54]|uniref:RING-type domain-containing protein n=1 Tax=Cladophialophora carrionii CBS 160.54 TaxID=1279043 RepID=V9CZF4_9EURO|nr:uncharacterized protein G647_09221 [Cladophialophora carrionii CBS 160.54]ETI19388.1 hypothetical protein G647_09221 [Cladophialophora carrionii CBS 160.54]
MADSHESTVLPSGQADAMLSSVPERPNTHNSSDYPQALESARFSVWRIPYLTREGPLGHTNIDGILRFVEAFVSEYLPSLPENQRGDSIEEFAYNLPTDLTIEDQATVGLPRAIELLSSDEDGPMPMEGLDDDAARRAGNFPWFAPSTIITRDPPSPVVPFYDPDIEGAAALNEIRIWVRELFSLNSLFFDIQAQMSSMVRDMGASDDPLRLNAQRLLDEAVDDLIQVSLPSLFELSLDKVQPRAESLADAERHVVTAKEKLFLAEAYLVTQEALLLASGDEFKAHASRYERTRYRDHLRWLVSNLQTARLRGIFICSSSTELEPVTRSYDTSEDSCPVCREDLPEEGEIAHPPAVSFACCNKGFHVDCLLEWLFENFSEDMDCPMCRKELDLDFLGALMEQKVQELQCL